MLINNFTARIAIKIINLARYSSVATPLVNGSFQYKPKCSKEEEEKILNVLNCATKDELVRFNVSQARIKSLQNWKIKNGPFKALDEILEVEGLGVKVLEKICDNIISEKPQPKQTKSNNGSNRKKQFLVSPLTCSKELSSALGVHLGPTGVSWAKLVKDGNKLTRWNYLPLTELPKKLLPTETFELALNILANIPTADVYVFEAAGNVSPQGQNQTSVTSYTQQIELSSMILALINTSLVHNKHLKESQFANQEGQMLKETENTVFYLRSKIPARLFGTLVGNEKVSTISLVEQLVKESPQDDFNLPCTAINSDFQLKQFYKAQLPFHKELLGQALMLVIAFMDLCIYKNPASITALTPGRKTKC